MHASHLCGNGDCITSAHLLLEEDEANLRIEAATTQHGLEERIRALEAEAVVHARQFQSLTLTTLDFFCKSLNVK